MMNKQIVRSISLLILTLSLTACSVFDSTPDKQPLKGERLTILDLQRQLQPSSDMDPSKIISMPTAIQNKEWTQRGGNPTHVMQNLFVGETAQLERIWNADIGQGSTKELPLTAQPIVAKGKVFTLDTETSVRAFHDQTGKLIWKADVQHLVENDDVISGGLAYNNNKIFVTSGFAEVIAIDAESGTIIWRTKISAGSRAAPTVNNGRVFVNALNNNAIALDAETGKVLWEYEGVGETTGLLGAGSPAADDEMIIAAFSSGDLVALRVENGSVIWSDNLGNSLRLGAMAGLSDIRGLPVMNGDMVIAVSFGGKMAAFDKRNGNIVWQTEVSSAETPWIAGNAVYVMSSDHKLMAFDITNGQILWISEVQKYDDPKKRKGLLAWSGPIMTGGRLLLAGTGGRMVEYNPLNGAELARWGVRKDIDIAPIVSDGAIYVLAEDGSLLAYR